MTRMDKSPGTTEPTMHSKWPWELLISRDGTVRDRPPPAEPGRPVLGVVRHLTVDRIPGDGRHWQATLPDGEAVGDPQHTRKAAVRELFNHLK